MKSRMHSIVVYGMGLLALAGWGCREKSTQADDQQSGEADRLSAGRAHAQTGGSHPRAQVRQSRQEVAKARGRFLELWQSDGALSAEAAEQLNALIGKEVSQWNQKQIKDLIDELLAGDASDPQRASLCISLLGVYARLDPESALSMFEALAAQAPPDQFNFPSHLVLNLADRDPLLAAQWLARQQEKAATLEGRVMMQKIIRKAAESDPAVAITLLKSQPTLDAEMMARELADGALTRDQKIQLLDALHNRIDDADAVRLRELRPHLLQKLGASFIGTTVEETRKWVEAARMSPEEIRHFAQGFKAPRNPDEAQKRSTWLKEAGAGTP